MEHSKDPIRFSLHKETVAVLRTAQPKMGPEGGWLTLCSLSDLTLCCGSNDSPPTCCR
jgi:hypothetical protein